MVMRVARTLRHLFATRWGAHRRFTPRVLAEIERAIAEVESRHAGELRFAVEMALDLPHLWHDLPSRRRAVEVFGLLGVWDSAANNGVLIYVLLADRTVEIVADRGIAERVLPAEWDAVCREMQDHYRAGRWAEGSLAGVRAVGRLLAMHFPGERGGHNELPNQPVLL
jgi:uncharacterized membrane protein